MNSKVLPFLFLLAVACGDPDEATSSENRSDASTATKAPSKSRTDAGKAPPMLIPETEEEIEEERHEAPPAKKGAMVRVEASTLRAGSPPGLAGRSPESEMDDVLVEVPEFEIDVLPYPNDPAREPLTGVDWSRAEELCREAGKRLCHELEWELACEGEKGLRYPTGNRWDPTFWKVPNDVISPLKVRAMGTIAEWTSGEYGGDTRAYKVVRGTKSEGADADSRRCARRSKIEEATTTADWLGFRCCKGPAPELTYETPVYEPPFQRLELEHEEFQKMIRSVPELSKLHDDPTMFNREDLYKIRADSNLEGNITSIGALTYKAVRWIPRLGDEIIVATGKNGDDSFIVAIYQLPENRYAHAGSYILVNAKAPLLLAYTRNPRHIRWLPCWGCADGGLAEIDDRGLVRISQRWSAPRGGSDSSESSGE